jgi:hypothetical protein
MTDARKRLFVMPQHESADAPNQLVHLFHLIGDELCDLPENVTRPLPIRTIRLNDAFPHTTDAISPELSAVLFSFNTDPRQAEQYAPRELIGESTIILIVNIDHSLQEESVVDQDTMYVFMNNGWARTLYPEGRADKVTSRYSGWRPMVFQFLEDQGRRLQDLGLEFQRRNDTLAGAGRVLVEMGRRSIGLIKILDQEHMSQKEERRSSLVQPWDPHRLLPTAHSRG